MRPYPGPMMNDEAIKIYNYRHSRTPCVIESSFAILSSWSQPINLVITSLKVGFHIYLSQPWFLSMQPKTINTIQLVRSQMFFQDFLFLLGLLFGQMESMDEWMQLVSCRRQGMLAQGPAPDPRCKLKISSFFTLSYLLD